MRRRAALHRSPAVEAGASGRQTLVHVRAILKLRRLSRWVLARSNMRENRLYQRGEPGKIGGFDEVFAGAGRKRHLTIFRLRR